MIHPLGLLHRQIEMLEQSDHTVTGDCLQVGALVSRSSSHANSLPAASSG